MSSTAETVTIVCGIIQSAGTLLCVLFAWRNDRRIRTGGATVTAPLRSWLLPAAILATGAAYCFGYFLYLKISGAHPYWMFGYLICACAGVILVWQLPYRSPLQSDTRDSRKKLGEVKTEKEMVADEKTALDYRIQGLTRFKNGDTYPKLPAEKRRQVDRQLYYMKGYSGVLGERISGKISEESLIISDTQRKQIKLAGVVESKAGQAKWLTRELEKVWHAYNNEKDLLLRPLGEVSLPDPPVKHCEKMLYAFRVHYRGHIGGVKDHLPDFRSGIVIDDKSPFRNIEYVDLMQQLRDHAEKLHQLAASLESSAKEIQLI